MAQVLKNFDPTRERCWIAERNAARVGAVMIVKHSDTSREHQVHSRTPRLLAGS